MNDMTEALVLVARRAGYAVVTLNRPRALNALSVALMRALIAALDQLEADQDIRGVILTGAGRAFCAGMDLKELQAPDGPLSGRDGLWSAEVPNAVRRVTDFSKPVIAAVNGDAVTGGFELALACDLIVASTRARFADTHARIGIVPGGGVSQLLSRSVGIHRAKELHFTGNFLTADRAEHWGLVNRVVAPEVLIDAAEALMQTMLDIAPATLTLFKQLIDDGYALALQDARQLEETVARREAERSSASDLAQRSERLIARGRAQRD